MARWSGFAVLSSLLCIVTYVASNRLWNRFEGLRRTAPNVESPDGTILASSIYRQQLPEQKSRGTSTEKTLLMRFPSKPVMEWDYSEQSSWPRSCMGRRQSPIDIRRNETAWAGESLWPNFRFVTNKGMGVMNENHAIILFGDAFNFDSILFDNATWPLSQITFHRKSEHRIDGQQFEMEAELLFSPSGTNLSLVLSILFHLSNESHPFLNDLNWQHLPSVNGQGTGVSADIDLYRLMPSWPDFFYYSGSLTSPPCTEGIHRLVLLNSVGISSAQLSAFPFASNSRAPQPLNGRVVTYHHFTSAPTSNPTPHPMANQTEASKAIVDAKASIAAEASVDGGLTAHHEAFSSAQRRGQVAAKLKQSTRKTLDENIAARVKR